MQVHISTTILTKSSRLNKPLVYQQPSFTGVKQRVNHLAGKDLGKRCLFTSQGDAMSKKGLGLERQGHFLGNTTIQTNKKKELQMKLKPYIPLAILIGVCFLASDAFAQSNDMIMKAEITKLEAFITGGYMRLGGMAVAIGCCVIGAIQQKWMLMASGAAGLGALSLMKGWVETTYTMVI